MNRLLIGALAVALGTLPAAAQSLDDLNIQIHGYATQGFLYTTQNNIFTTKSSNGSPAWTEAVVNITAQPTPKLRIGVQGRYFLLGNLGNAITLDWAAADYKADDRFGVRFGKVKTPSGLLNDIQDIDPSYIWALLPQSIYPLMSRNSLLAHYGGVVYGTFKLGPGLGKLEYRGWGGERVLPGTDGYFLNQTEGGISLPNGLGGVTTGAALHWRTPLAGLMIGASDTRDNIWSAPLVLTTTVQGIPIPFSGTETLNAFNTPYFFARYEKDKWMVAGEQVRLPVTGAIAIPGVLNESVLYDQRSWYGMTSYKITDKLTAGVYDTQSFDHQSALGPARYLKDWAINGHYDFNQFLYAKVEQHIYNGTLVGYDDTLNPPTASLPTGLQPNTRLTILKIGMSF
ncbi:MAG TPA: hypothetical protein VGG56_05725 [Terracidiphilus sp.]